MISNTAGGYSFYKDAKFRRITRYRYNGVPMDNGGRYFYIKDGDCIWNPGWKPCKTPLDSYECRHGMGYTRITGEKNGVQASVLFFVPENTWAEVQKVTLTNKSSQTKSLKLFSFVEWCLWNAQTDMENFQRNLSTGEVEIEGSVIYHKTEYRERRNHYAFYSVNRMPDGFDTNRESFQTTENRTEGSKAESLMIAGLFVYCGGLYSELCSKLSLSEEAERAAEAVDAMSRAVQEYGWDGEWYLRAYDFFGGKVGSSENEEGKIFIESQGWCSMAQIGKESRMPQRALDSVKKYLDCEHGMVGTMPEVPNTANGGTPERMSFREVTGRLSTTQPSMPFSTNLSEGECLCM